jgi:hypothetical protein
MKYGYVKNAAQIHIRKRGATPEQISWAKEHNSGGWYSYQVHGVYVDGVPGTTWNFSNESDAILFSLKFT